MLSVNDENYREYEVYYLMNFVLLGLGAQEEKFYVKSIISVSGNSHYQAVDLDHDFNSNITNPLYQLFASCFLNSQKIMPLLEDVFGGGDIYHAMNDERENLFDDEISERFFKNLEFNTSLDGFENGSCWQELRERSRLFLTKYSLLDNFDFPNPMKFSEFLYPDDFEKYDPAPRWSWCGQFISLEDWMRLKKMTLDAYDGIELALLHKSQSRLG